MQFPDYLSQISLAISSQNGFRLASLLSPHGDHVSQLLKNLQDSRHDALAAYQGYVVQPWGEISITHIQVLVNAAEENYIEAYKQQAILTNAFLRFFNTQSSWVLPILYKTLKDLRNFATLAEEQAHASGLQSNQTMEDAARICNKAFSNCLTDRTNKAEESRKWGVYHVVGLVLKCYFRVRKIGLSRQIIRALEAHNDIPSLRLFPRADQVTYRFYLGKYEFINENYTAAEEHLDFAFTNCLLSAHRNKELALTYLIPLRLIRGRPPSQELLDRFPRLRELYSPILRALKSGDLKGYDEALSWAEPRLTEMGVWLTVLRAREICMRGLFRKVWLVLNKSTRIPISAFHTGLRIDGLPMPLEETECYVANMIYKGHMKGYIAHEQKIVVLSGKEAFPQVGATTKALQ